MTFVVRFFLVSVLLTVPLACSQTESGRETPSTATGGTPEDSSRIIPESSRIDKTAGARDESKRGIQEKQTPDQSRDPSEVAQSRTPTGSDGSSQPVGGSEPPVKPDRPEEANWDSTSEQDQVDVKRERLNAARKKLRELSRQQKKQRKSQARQAKKYQNQAINRLERHMNKRGWKNFSLGEPSSKNEETPERSGTDEDNDRE